MVGVGRVVRASAYVVAWAVLAVAIGVGLFLAGSRTIALAGHDAVVRPNLSGEVVVRTGPVLPDLRLPAGGRVGVDVTLGKTDASSVADLVQRYALLATRPEAQRARLTDTVTSMAYDAGLRGAALALLRSWASRCSVPPAVASCGARPAARAGWASSRSWPWSRWRSCSRGATTRTAWSAPTGSRSAAWCRR